MFKNFHKPVHDLEGNEMPNASLARAAVGALLALDPKTKSDEKMKRYILAQKVAKEEGANFSTEELTKIKELVGENFAPLVVGRMFDYIESEEVEVPAPKQLEGDTDQGQEVSPTEE